MSTKIIVAGGGHGGIAAAAILAESGYDVTVYEKQSEDHQYHLMYRAEDYQDQTFRNQTLQHI